ncbi:transposase [Arcobacter cryaerophilus gv. pseudocryaerophilus]
MLSLLHKVQDAKLVRVLILDDTVEDKVGKNIEGSCDNLWSNKAKRKIRGVNVVSLNYSDGYSNFMLDFAIAMNNYARVKIEEFTNIIDHRTNAHKRRLESLKGKSQIAIEMIKRAVASGIYADYLLVDSWYSKPVFIETMNELGLQVISRMVNNDRIWNFTGEKKLLMVSITSLKSLKLLRWVNMAKR